MKNIVTLLIMVLSLSSCFSRSTPYYDLTVTYDQTAPTEWKLGWQHGCESGLSAYGNNYYKTLYKFHQDVSMVSNEYYFKGWNDAMNFCRSFINRSLAGDYRNTSEENPTLFSTKNLDITTGRKRDDAPIVKQGLFGGKAERRFMSDMFDVKTPGYGSTAWGASADRCDWLNRCGDDKPKDPVDAMLGR